MQRPRRCLAFSIDITAAKSAPLDDLVLIAVGIEAHLMRRRTESLGRRLSVTTRPIGIKTIGSDGKEESGSARGKTGSTITLVDLSGPYCCSRND